MAVTFNFEPGLPRYVYSDASHLREILIYLFNNALKHSSGGGVIISVSCSSSSEEFFVFTCAVQDTGIGLEKEGQGGVVDELTMPDQSFPWSYGGAGLSLAICKRLVSVMNGHLEFRSATGLGFTFAFSVELKCSSRSAGEEMLQSDRHLAQLIAGTRILLAEDNRANQLVFKSYLECAGLQVDIVSNGREALDAVRNSSYDIVLMDISMPELDGLQATREIRQSSGESGNIPILALTGHALIQDKERLFEAGVNDYLTKPIVRIDLLNCISRWLPGTVCEKSESSEEIVESIVSPLDEQYEYVREPVLLQLVSDTAADIVPELLRLYVDDAKIHAKSIQEAVKGEDIKLLEFEAHTLGSSAAAHGNEKLYRLARKIEDLCLQNDHQPAFERAAGLSNIATESFRQLLLRADEGFESVK